MAAYAALVSLARVIDQILPQDQDYLSLCDKEQMESLHEKIIRLQEFLEYISMKSHSSRVDVLESRIRDVAYQLEDTIEPLICRSLGQDFEEIVHTPFSLRPTSVAVRSIPEIFHLLLACISCFGGCGDGARSDPTLSVAESSTPSLPLLSAVFCSCIEEIDILLEEATEIKNIIVNKYILGAFHSSTTSSSSRVAPIAEDTKVGLNKDLTQILDRITGQGSKLQIIPITGMGGIGKTTLARAVYEDKRMLHRFDVRLWVTVSQEYDINEVLRGLLPAKERSKVPVEKLIEHVHKSLNGRRFLIVLDDMWHEKAWDGVMNALPDDNNGSRVILTTRLLGVATYADSSSHVHAMQLLNEDQSWVLLREKVYGNEPCHAEFEVIGRTISKNCKGLPLAVVVIAGLLKFNKTKDYWKEVAENTNVAAATNYDHLYGILSLSYTNLPLHLKACFLYMGAFPEDFKIQTKDLVMLWTAEGFLKPRESKRMEEVAAECLEELVERSLVLVMEKTYNGKIKTSSMHDVLREVSIRKAHEEKFFHCFSDSTTQNIIKDQRRVSFCKTDLTNFDIYNAPVRSFMCTNLRVSELVPIIQRFKLLRVLNERADGSMLTHLCRLTNLRYLHLTPGVFGVQLNVPRSISKLQNLETLVFSSITSYYSYVVLPLEIWKLPRLRHLVLLRQNTLRFPVASQGYPVLESLQTLFVWRNINFSTSVIEKIPNIKKLKLEYRLRGCLDYWHKFSLNNLQHLHKVEELRIKLSYGFAVGVRLTDFNIPRNLKKLGLHGTRIPVENMSTVGLLPNLEVLKLKQGSIVGENWEPVEGEFLQLKYLKMERLSIKDWRAESIHFPCLEKLVIESCEYLEEVPESIGEMDTLQKLILDDCPKARESVQKLQENQHDLGNDSLEVIIVR